MVYLYNIQNTVPSIFSKFAEKDVKTEISKLAIKRRFENKIKQQYSFTRTTQLLKQKITMLLLKFIQNNIID